MPQIRVKPNQMIELLLGFGEKYEFHCDSITDGVLLVLLNAKQRRLTVAHATPELTAVAAFLLSLGTFATSNKDTECHLIGGTKSDQALFDNFYTVLKQTGFNFKKAANDYENALVVLEPDGHIQFKNIPSKEDQPDFPDFTDRRDDITDLLTDYRWIGDGGESRTKVRKSMLATLRVADDGDPSLASANSDESFDEAQWKAVMDEADALCLELEQSSASPISSSKKELISQVTAVAVALPIYLVNAWQIAVISLANGRKVKLDPSGGKIGLVVCDEVSGTLAVCLLGTGANMQAAISTVTQKCMTYVKTRSEQLVKTQQKPSATSDKPATQRSIVFHVMFDGASKDMGAAVKLKTESAAKKLGLVAQQFPGNLPQGAHSCFLEWEAGKLQIKPDGKDLGPAYRAKMITLDESGFAQVKQMERSSAEWVLYKDYISVKDIPVIVEIQDSCVFAIDLTKKKCLIRLQEKTLLFAAYCSHLSRGVFFQIKTEEFKKYILNAKLTEGHFMMLNAMSNFPRDDKAPAVKMFIFCREKKTGHANDATACMEYVRDFSKCYSEFAAGATDIFMKREGTKYQLHRMEEHVNVHFYSEKDISKYYLFEASGNKLEFTLTSISDQEKGELVVVKKGAALSKHAYKELGIKAFDNYKSASFVADRKSGKRS